MENQELQHYGVPGMKWGVKKAVYKSMTGQQRRAQKKQFKADVRSVRKDRGFTADLYEDGSVKNFQFRGRKVDDDYANAVLSKIAADARRKRIGLSALSTTATVGIGAAVCASLLRR